MQSETGFPSSHQLKSYVASKSRLKLAARAVLSSDAGLLVYAVIREKENGVPYMGCFSCALPLGRTFVFGLPIKPKNLKTFSKKVGFFQPCW